MKMDQNTTQTSTALLRNTPGVDITEINSLCCAAAGIIAPLSATAESLIPHEKLREAATPDETLVAQNRPPAQLVQGYKRLSLEAT
jgi:Fe-S oxidoreductase